MRIGAGGAVALPAPGGLALGLGRTLAGVSEQRWLDRLIRGRLWIGLIAFALIGIVAMQLWIVKLGVGIGRALEHEAFLQRENAALRIADAQLSSGERVEALAAARGMVVAAPGSLRFLSSRPSLDARLAAGALARRQQEQEQEQQAQAHTAETETASAATSTTGETNASTSAETSASGTASGETSAATGETSPSGEASGTAATGTGAGGEASGTATGSNSAATGGGTGGASATGESSASGAGGAAPGG